MEMVVLYEPEHFFSCVESEIFFQMAPDGMIAACPVNRRKAQKSRFILLLGCNPDGSHIVPFFLICTAAFPRSSKKKVPPSLD